LAVVLVQDEGPRRTSNAIAVVVASMMMMMCRRISYGMRLECDCSDDLFKKDKQNRNLK
jgi:hypothetical protein